MFYLQHHWACVKRKILCNCLSSPSSSCDSASLIRNIWEFGKKIILQTIEQLIHFSFFPINWKFFEFILFQNKSQRRGIPQILLDKYSHLFICTSLKQTSRTRQKPVYIVQTPISVQCFGQVLVFYRLINKSVLQWFLLIMCK